MDFLNFFFRSLIISLIISLGSFSTSTAQLFDNVDTHVRIKPHKVKIKLKNNSSQQVQMGFEVLAVDDLDDIQFLVDEGVIIYQDDVLTVDEGVIIYQDDVLRIDEGVIIYQDDVLSVDEGVIIYQDDVLTVDEGVIIYQDDVLRVAEGGTTVRKNQTKNIHVFLEPNHSYAFYIVIFKLISPTDPTDPTDPTSGRSAGGENAVNKVVDNTATPIQSLSNEGLLVYPNPSTSGDFRVNFPEMETDCTLNIYDTDGRLLHTNTVNKHTAQQAIQMSQLTSGKYLITLDGEQGQYSQWIMITQ